jgi:predicted ArsR family transcriptional regulator
MSEFTGLAMKPKEEIPKNIDEQIAECKAEIAELEGNGTIVSAVINFAKEGGKALFSSASSSDNGKKDSEDKDKKLIELKTKLADLSAKKRPQGQDGKSSDSSNELSKDELKGDLSNYVNQLNDAGIPYEVVRKGGMIGIKTTTQGDDPKSMPNMIENFMKKVGGKMSDNADNNVENSGLDDATKLQLSEVLYDLNEAGVIKPDDKDTEKSVQNPEDKSQEQDDKMEKGQNPSPPKTPKVESQKEKGPVR